MVCFHSAAHCGPQRLSQPGSTLFTRIPRPLAASSALGRTSITMHIQVEVERGLEVLQVTEAEVVYVGIDPDTTPGGLYVFRMFGIRTVFIAWELLFATGQRRANAVNRAPIIHASDTIAALLAANSGLLPGRSGLTITLISAVNTALALYARQGLRS